MITLLNSDSIDAELHKKMRTSVIMFSPIEGTSSKLLKLASKIALPVYGVNFTSNLIGKSIEKISTQVHEALDQILQKSEKLVLIGYSFGCSIALELANDLLRP